MFRKLAKSIRKQRRKKQTVWKSRSINFAPYQKKKYDQQDLCVGRRDPQAELTASVYAKEVLTLNVWYRETIPVLYSTGEMTASNFYNYENEHPGIRLALHSLDSASYKEKLAEDFAGKARI